MALRGMVFSTFCGMRGSLHIPANYQILARQKLVWYSREDAAKFEEAMREAVPEAVRDQPRSPITGSDTHYTR